MTPTNQGPDVSSRVDPLGGAPATAVLWACFVVTVLLVALRWIDSTVGIVVLLQSMVPLAGVLLVVLTALAAFTRRWRLTVASGALLALCAAMVAPLFLSRGVPSGPDDLVVMSANLEYGGGDAQTLVGAARQHRVDVLVLLEVTPAAVERLGVAGLNTLLPESVGRSSQDAAGTIVRSRLPMTLRDPLLDQIPPNVFKDPIVSIRRSTGAFVLRAIHARPPGLSGAADWRLGFAEMQAWRERQPLDQPVVMAGDFNASWDHPGFRAVAETMTDAHRATGQGWVRTWPQGRRLIPPYVQLDHVLVRGLGVVDAGVVYLPNTDHAAVWARLSPHRP
jgi:endonuclease/exonuclease/phosphatase (EEP) superfamily protein YafD